jgi:hypothetical protein
MGYRPALHFSVGSSEEDEPFRFCFIFLKKNKMLAGLHAVFLRKNSGSFSHEPRVDKSSVMYRYGIEKEMWFELARAGLERRGFRLRVQQRSIVVEKDQRLPRLMGSAREFLEFVERQGLRVDKVSFAAADRYGDARSNMTGRASPSQFESPSPLSKLVDPGPVESGLSLPPLPPAPVFGRAGLAEADRPPLDYASIRLAHERTAAERRQAFQVPPPINLQELQERCQALETRNATLELRHTEMRAELARAAVSLMDAAKQRDLYETTANAAETRVRLLQVELDGPPDERGPDKKFNQLRRFLARELHPDLAGEDAAERMIRETIFKRVWAKIEQLQ